MKELYTEQDLPPGLAAELGLPGSFPFTRGIYPTMYRGRLWTMRQYAGFGNAKEANERYHYLLKQGSTGLSVAFDLPTQMGRDSDHALARGEVGRVGVAISSVEDMKVLLDKIPLSEVSISMTINATAAILLAFTLIVAEESGTAWPALRGTIQNDILKEYMARGTYIFPPQPALRLITDIFSFCRDRVPQWNTISISGYHIREAGSTAAQEIAFTLADGIAYVEAAIKAGLRVDEFGPRLAFFFNGHLNFFEEIAKYRAARRLWAKIMRDRFGARDPKSQMLRFHTQTAGSSLTAQQPLNNVVRTTWQAIAAVLGGTQSLHTNAYDEALGLPTADSALLALRTQQLLADESGIAESADPLAGSYLVESLTTALEHEAWTQLETIDTLGGMVAAIEQGYPQAAIERAAYEYQKTIESGDRVVVGVNKYQENTGSEPPALKIDESGEREQCTRLAELRAKRNPQAVRTALIALEQAAGTNTNILPFIIEAARVRTTLGEISDALRAKFGEYRSGSSQAQG